MRESEKAEAYTAAINLLVDQAVTAANPKSPGAYAATVRADLSQRHRDAARDAFRQYGDLSGEHLALLLSAADQPVEPPSPSVSLPTVTASTPREPATPKAKARERVASIKEQLRTVTKPPMPAKESA